MSKLRKDGDFSNSWYFQLITHSLLLKLGMQALHFVELSQYQEGSIMSLKNSHMHLISSLLLFKTIHLPKLYNWVTRSWKNFFTFDYVHNWLFLDSTLILSNSHCSSQPSYQKTDTLTFWILSAWNISQNNMFYLFTFLDGSFMSKCILGIFAQMFVSIILKETCVNMAIFLKKQVHNILFVVLKSVF